MSVISFDAVTKTFGDFTALDAVSVAFAENTITGLLGRNGAGKTTMMQVATGQAFTTSGSIRVFGECPVENAGVLDRICFISENQRYPDVYRVKHVLAAARTVFDRWDQPFADQLVSDFGLRTGQRVKKLSRGQRSAVGVIVGLAARAPVTFFDEPYLGLDAVARQLFYDRLLADYAANPRTVILSTHLIDEIADLVEHVLLIDQGRVLLDEDVDTLRGSAVVVSGPTSAVEAYAAGHDILHREALGGLTRLTVRRVGSRGGTDDGPAHGVTVEPVSLQQLVIHTTSAPSDLPAQPRRHQKVDH